MLLGFGALRILVDGPHKAKWLTPDEAAWLTNTIDAENRAKVASQGHVSFLRSLAGIRTLTLAFIYYSKSVAIYVLAFFTPSIVKALGDQLSNTSVGFITALPYAAAAVFMVWWAELHIGTYNDEPGGGPGGLAGVVERLDHLVDLGVTAIQVLPPAEFPGGFYWGYNPSSIFAVETDYGGPQALRNLIGAAHHCGLAVLCDVVYNHFGWADSGTWRFDGWHHTGKGGIYFYNDWRTRAPQRPPERRPMTPARGQVYRCDVGFGLKPWLIVSNNARNRHTADVLAIGLTTTVRQLPTWVPLSRGDPLTGYANADNIETLGKDELGDHLGALTPETMRRVNRALAIALALAN